MLACFRNVRTCISPTDPLFQLHSQVSFSTHEQVCLLTEVPSREPRRTAMASAGREEQAEGGGAILTRA